MIEAPAATQPAPIEETPADELLERYARIGLTRKIAEAIAADLARGGLSIDTDRIRGQAMDSLMRAESADTIKLILFRIFESPKPRLSIGCLLLAVGVKPIGITSERDLAKQQNVSPEHASNGVQEWQQVLGLPRVEFQKSAESIESYKTHHRTNGKKR